MKPTKEMIGVAQEVLNKHFQAGITHDGIIGPQTKVALLLPTQVPNSWTINRQIIGVLQVGAILEGFDAGPVDGYYGPQTDTAYSELKYKLTTDMPPKPWRDDDVMYDVDAVSTGVAWPMQNQHDLVSYFGNVGTNQTKVTVPYTLRIAWNLKQKVNRITCHEKVADATIRVLTRVKDHYGDQVSDLGLDLFGGCLNVRKIRGGTSYSTHSWGISFDFDPARNRLKWNHKQAEFAKPVYGKWFELWAEEGAIGLGPTRDYDWMHTQFARIKRR